MLLNSKGEVFFYQKDASHKTREARYSQSNTPNVLTAYTFYESYMTTALAAIPTFVKDFRTSPLNVDRKFHIKNLYDRGQE